MYGLSFRKDDIAIKASNIGIKVKSVERELYNKRKIHFEKQTEKIYQEIEKDLRTNNEFPRVDIIDQKIRKYISEVEPNKNVWLIIDDYGERRWQDMLHEFSQQKYQELKSIEQQKLSEKERCDQEQNHQRRRRRR